MKREERRIKHIAWIGPGLIMFAIQATAVYGSEQINDKNWRHHPAVENIRASFNEINAAQKSGKLKKEAKKCELFEGSVLIDGELYIGANSVVRKYVIDGGSEDSRARAEYYYNERGVPRFTYRFRGAFNGTQVEERIYFDENGKEVVHEPYGKRPRLQPEQACRFRYKPAC